MIAKRTEKLKNRKVIKKPKPRKEMEKPKQRKENENPKNKIQILIDDSVFQKLISAMGFGAVK